MKLFPKKLREIVFHTLVGAFIGIVVLHPVTKIVYWFEFRHDLAAGDENLWRFLLSRLDSTFVLEMVPMSLVFAFIGGGIGLAFAIYHLALIRQQQTVYFLEKELAEDLPALIKDGEGEHLEFKSSVRWDFHQGKINKALEMVIARTLVGFMNHRGGSLLIGVDDEGEVVGLEHDYKTLKIKGRDGFELCITDIVTSRIGADMCSFIHCVFYEIESKDVCRVIVESAVEPVYLQDGNISRYFLRTGNGTRELDAREAMAHITRQ